LIIIDDVSADNSWQFVKSLAENEPRIKLIRLNENSGAAVAQNKGNLEARGRSIAFLDSDDLWLSEKLEWQLAFMNETGSAFSYTDVARYDIQGSQACTSKIPDKVDYANLLKTNEMVCSSARYDTQQLGKVYMPDIRKRQDNRLITK